MSAAPGESSVPLLPFGPGGIKSLPPRRACPDEARIPEVGGRVNLLNEFSISAKGLELMPENNLIIMAFIRKYLPD